MLAQREGRKGLGHALEVLQRTNLNNPLGWLGSDVHRLARLEGVWNVLTSWLSRLYNEIDLAQAWDLEDARALLRKSLADFGVQSVKHGRDLLLAEIRCRRDVREDFRLARCLGTWSFLSHV